MAPLNGGELRTTQNQSPTHWPTSLLCSLTANKLASSQGLYWICGKQAYMVLPSSWFESCVLGTIRPSFLLPLRQGENLGVPIYEERLNRQKRGDLQIGNWNDNEWPPKQIIHTIVLPLGQKTDLVLLHPNLYAQLHHQAAGCCRNDN
jgi:hypothetical protein